MLSDRRKFPASVPVLRPRWLVAAMLAATACGVVSAAHAAIVTPQHIVVVIDENHSYSQIVGDTTDAPYINNTLIGSGWKLAESTHCR